MKDLLYFEVTNHEDRTGISHTLIEGEWRLEWMLNYGNNFTQTIDVNEKVNITGKNDNTITTISLSPTRILIYIEGDDIWTAFVPIVKMKDGSEIVIEAYSGDGSVYAFRNIDLDNTRGRFKEDGSVKIYGQYIIQRRFDRITDIADIESVVIGDVEIRVP
jgi:hypothetical protein